MRVEEELVSAFYALIHQKLPHLRSNLFQSIYSRNVAGEQILTQLVDEQNTPSP